MNSNPTNAPRSPVYGVIFLFKFPTDTPYRRATDPIDGTFDPSASENPSFFFAHQTIQNACGTQALLSILLNKENNLASVTDSTSAPSDPSDPRVDVGTTLRAFKDFTLAFPPALRGESLSNSSPIRAAHNAFARASPFVSEAPRDTAADAEDVFHFIAYTPAHGTLYELDGLQEYPISHGPCTSDTKTFAARVVPVLRRRVERYQAGEIRFNLLAVTRDRRGVMRERGDWDGLEREEGKRRAWEWENCLRRSNLVGFAGEVLRCVARGKVREGQGRYEEWVEGARGQTRERVEERRRRGGGDEEMEVDG